MPGKPPFWLAGQQRYNMQSNLMTVMFPPNLPGEMNNNKPSAKAYYPDPEAAWTALAANWHTYASLPTGASFEDQHWSREQIADIVEARIKAK